MKIEILLNEDEAKAIAEFMRRKYSRVWPNETDEEKLARFFLYDQISELTDKAKQK